MICWCSQHINTCTTHYSGQRTVKNSLSSIGLFFEQALYEILQALKCKSFYQGACFGREFPVLGPDHAVGQTGGGNPVPAHLLHPSRLLPSATGNGEGPYYHFFSRKGQNFNKYVDKNIGSRYGLPKNCMVILDQDHVQLFFDEVMKKQIVH